MAVNAGGEDQVSPAGSGGSTPSGFPVRPPAQQPQGVTSPRLQNILNELYKGVTHPRRTGDGTTADAIRWERASGETVVGRRHLQKGVDSIRGLKRWLRQNPYASAYERGIAQNEMSNLLDAFGRTW
jgi:hypothetical protein